MNGVSIHAPTRGATFISVALRTENTVSIHAPTRGATVQRYTYLYNVKFQSTHPRGVRLGFTWYGFRMICVSIHAPTRGATAPLLASPPRQLFQSTHPRGVRLNLDYSMMKTIEFQSTHPRGVRHEIHVDNELSRIVSIHAPTRGATALPRI